MSDEQSVRWRWEKAVRASDLSSTQKLVLLVIGTHIDSGGEAFPSLTTLAEGASLGRSTVARTLRQVESVWLRIDRRRVAGKSRHDVNRYQVIVPERDQGSPRAGLGVVPERDQVVPERDQAVVPERDPNRPVRTDQRTEGPALDVFEYWRDARERLLGRNGSGVRMQPSTRRLSKVRARLSEGYTTEQLRSAVDGCFSRKHNVAGGYLDLELICRDQAHVEQYLSGRAEPDGPPLELL